MEASIGGDKQQEIPHKDKKTFVILTCDGGGVRALLQLMFLEQLAKDVGSPLPNFIDSTTLCSGGAITGLSLIAKKDTHSFKSAPRFNENEAKQVFLDFAPMIFPQPPKGRLTKIFNKYAPQALQSLVSVLKTLWKIKKHNGIYSSENQEAIFYKLFGDLKARDTVMPFFIPTTDFHTGDPIWLTNLKGCENSHMFKHSERAEGERIYYVPDMKLADVLLASIRPPILFNLKTSTILYKERDESGVYKDHKLNIIGTDGGFYAASPENYAYGLALHWLENIKKMKRDEYRIVMLAIGTGRKRINNNVEHLKELDPITQFQTIKDLALVLPYRAGQGMLRSRMTGNGDIYLRFDGDIDDRDPTCPSTSLSDTTPENIEKFENFVKTRFISGCNQKEYEFAVKLFTRIAQRESIEDLVAQRLGERYWPLKERKNGDGNSPQKRSLIGKFFDFMLGVDAVPSQKPANEDRENPFPQRRNGSDPRP